MKRRYYYKQETTYEKALKSINRKQTEKQKKINMEKERKAYGK